MSQGDSPGPDGLRIRQTRDATVIRVFPHAPGLPWRELVASVAALVVWALLRWLLHHQAPESMGWMFVLHGALLAVLGSLAVQMYRRTQQGSEVLEVYVGKRFLQLVSTRGGSQVARRSLELVLLEDAEMGPDHVVMRVEEADPIVLPMARHSDEARAWMVEHLRGAGLGARRRFGHLPTTVDEDAL